MQSLVPSIRRDVVLDIRAPCDRVITFLASKNPGDFFAGAARLVERGEKRDAAILVFSSTLKREYRVEVRLRKEPDRLVYEAKGDLNGKVIVTAVSRGATCRLYIEAEMGGPLVEEYGGDAVSRIVNRFVVGLVSSFPAVLQPRAPGGKLGDIFVELLNLLSMAQGGQAKFAGGSTIRSMAVDLTTSNMINVDGLPEDQAARAARGLSEAISILSKALEELGEGQVQRIVIATQNSIVFASVAGGVGVITVLKREEE
ncbi:hypothetical protein Pyrde_0905 [Pyrodictium delaneyi]|uniref:Uncharacterized protein n=1 Tax=Pyrodictium delaneyi TaxID=1273541 RepID=A0A0N7JD18_9CREN|nr:hypothetical protein Pyrde_0905 [Pyrodictium delaneyi]